MSFSYFSDCLKGEMFVKKENQDEDISSEDDDSSEDDIADEDTDSEDSQDDEEEIDVGVDDYSKYNQNPVVKVNQRDRSRRVNKPPPRKRNHNNMEKKRRTQLAMCYDALRSVIGQPDISRNRALELMMERITELVKRNAEMDKELKHYENLLRKTEESIEDIEEKAK